MRGTPGLWLFSAYVYFYTKWGKFRISTYRMNYLSHLSEVKISLGIFFFFAYLLLSSIRPAIKEFKWQSPFIKYQHHLDSFTPVNIH